MSSEPFTRLRRFLRELKRRKVYRVAAGYLVAAFVVLQLAGLAADAFGFPGWFQPMIWVMAGLGFPLAVVLAWAFEMTPEGMRRTPEAEPAEWEASGTAGRLSTGYKVLVGLGIVAAAAAGGWYLTGGGGSSISDRSVAVLPFETLGDTSQRTFAEGLHSDLLTRLQRISDLTVIARPSVIRYQNREKPLSQVANELGARWIVSATVQTSGDQVRVQPRLIDPRAGTERWSDSYRREISTDGIFAVSQEITRSIAGALETELAAAEQERVGERPTEDLDAYRLYVEGRRQFARRSGACPSCIKEAVRLFQKAIESDSSFALAWAGLADAAGVSAEWPDTVVGPDVRQEVAARRALELDPDLAEAHAAMGHVHLRNMDAPAARRELRRAIDLTPSYWEAHHWLAELYLKIGRAEQAVEHLELAVELNPQHARARHWLYDAYLAAGQPKKSLREARRQQEMGLEEEAAVGGEVRALYQLGRLAEARRVLREHIQKLEEGDRWRGYFRSLLGVVAAAAGDTAEARDRRDQLGGSFLIDAALGDGEAVLEALEQADRDYFYRIGGITDLRYGGDWNPDLVRDDPRYRKILRRANQAWGLNPDGSFPSGDEPDPDD